MQRNLIIFIVGTTAVGKTRLSLQIAKLLNGQIISCDSKQLYRHANILTAKATNQQKSKAQHHMIDCLNLDQSTYNRNKYFSQAMHCVSDVRKRGKVPIVIGGTNYYLETLLYDIAIGINDKHPHPQNNQEDKEHKEDKQQSNQGKDQVFDQKGLEAMQKLEPLQKFELLKKVDPKMSQKVHKNDQIRITNFLQKYYTKGIVPSTTYKPYTQQLRNPQTILFWIRNSDKQQQRNLIKKRVHQMLDAEGIKQILAIFTFLRNNQIKESGITQTIGYKEFNQFYQQIQNQIKNHQKQYQAIAAYIQKNYREFKYNEELLKKCQGILIKNTTDYSKRQITWIKNRIFQGDHGENFFILQLQQNLKQKETQSLQARFMAQVRDKSFKIINLIQEKGFGSVKQSQQVFKEVFDSFSTWKKFKCETCNQQVNGQHEWEEHIKSRKHQRHIKHKEKEKYRKQMSLKNLAKKELNKQQNDEKAQDKIQEKVQEKQDRSGKQIHQNKQQKQVGRQNEFD